ncbi:MAG: M23 family metallopeptidase [Burkholderiaceae bacterium]
MPSQQRRVNFVIMVAAVAVMGLSSCGGGGGTAVGSSGQTASVTTSQLSENVIGADGGGGGGDGGFGIGGSLGKFVGATIAVTVDDGSSLGSATVGTDGMIAAQTDAGYAGSVIATVVGSATSTYFDEDKLAYLPTGGGTILRAAVPRLTKHLGVTPLTEGAVRNLETRVAAGQDPSIHDPAAISAANARVLAEINRVLPASIQLTDITMIPILVGSAAELNALPDNGRGTYARALAIFAIQAAKFNPSLSAPGLAFAQNLGNDLTDGRIDDKDANGNPAAPASGAAYRSSTLAADLADALNDLANASTKTAVIPTGGGTISLPNTVATTFPAGAFTAPRQVTVSAVSDPDLSTLFKDSAAIFSPTAEHSTQVTLQTMGEQPRSPITLNVTVPADFAARVPDGSEIRVFYLNRYENGGEVLETFEPIDTRAGKNATSFDVALPIEALSTRNNGASFESSLVLAATPTAPAAAANQSPFTSLKVVDPLVCAGGTLTAPLDSITVSNPFGSQPGSVTGVSVFHHGADLATADGTPVKAAADGTIEIRRQQTNGQFSGWGYYIILRHTDGSATLYGHLRDDSATLANGAAVKAGDTIALAGNTGTNGTAILHFEHAPNGRVFSAGTKGNPVPCFSTTATGSIAVRDNGSAADDAFSLSLNGSVVCTTTIGASNSCALGQLRPGSYSLVITATIAPDNLGTFEITISSPNMTINGTSRASGTVARGASATYSLIVN